MYLFEGEGIPRDDFLTVAEEGEDVELAQATHEAQLIDPLTIEAIDWAAAGTTALSMVTSIKASSSLICFRNMIGTPFQNLFARLIFCDILRIQHAIGRNAPSV